MRHKLGEGGASKYVEKQLTVTSKIYRRLKLSMSEPGLNTNVFDAKLPVRRKHPVHQKTEEEQVKQLIEKKGAFSAGAQWYAFGFQLLGSRTLIRAQVQQVENKRKSIQAQSTTRKAEEALTVWTATGKLMANQWKDILKFALAQWEPKAPLSKYSTMAKAKTKMKEFAAKLNRPWKEVLA